MIRVRLEGSLSGSVPASWKRKAATRLRKFRAAGRYLDKPAPVWSEIKPLFMELQHHKCVFCERQLGHGAIEHDLEHFRPKSSTVDWSPEADPGFAVRGGLQDGYWWLAYDLDNYAASCKFCNSTLKSNRFPIAGAPGAPEQEVAALNDGERPYLVFPIGEIDMDPSELFDFEGTLAVPAPGEPWPRARAAVTIDFFRLNREDLLKERAQAVTDVYQAYREWDHEGSDTARTALVSKLSRKMAHTCCRRAFFKRLRDEPARARALYEAAVSWLEQYTDEADPDLDALLGGS